MILRNYELQLKLITFAENEFNIALYMILNNFDALMFVRSCIISNKTKEIKNDIHTHQNAYVTNVYNMKLYTLMKLKKYSVKYIILFQLINAINSPLRFQCMLE